MRPEVITFCSSLLLVLILTPAVRFLAVRIGYVAQPKEDRWHKSPTALLGGCRDFPVILITISLVRTGLSQSGSLIGRGDYDIWGRFDRRFYSIKTVFETPGTDCGWVVWS